MSGTTNYDIAAALGACGRGLACLLPTLALLAARYASMRRHLDAKARRRYLGRTAAFGAAAFAACSLLAALGGKLALPAFWQVAAVALAALALLRSIGR